ncbi:cytochrome d ubiquinol oxidase subunit II [Enterococcus sp. LJL98]
MSGLQFFWFVVIGVFFGGFFFLEGFDFGVGMSLKTLAFDKKEEDQLIGTIGPVWDGNEVWLVTAGGAMFASFPYWYASLFSGYYLILLLILVGLIIRGVSFEFREKSQPQLKNIWTWTLAIGSFMVPFFFGVLFVSLIQGMPLDADGNMTATFTDYINLFSLVGGVALTLLSYLHGMNYIGMKTTGPVHVKARNHAQALYWVLYAGLAAFAVLLYLNTDFFELRFVSTSVLLVLIIALTVVANVALNKEKERTAFLASGLTIVTLVGLLFNGLFPRVMISSISSEFDLLIQNATSTPYTLKIMSMISLTILPFVLGYTAWSYYIFRGRIKHDDPAGYGE